MENLQKMSSIGEDGKDSNEESGIDALTKALGKKDKRGHVKVLGRCGVGVSHTKVFGKPNRKRTSGCTLDELEDMKAALNKDFEARLDEKVEEKFQETLNQRVAMEVQAYLSSLTSENTSKVQVHGEKENAPEVVQIPRTVEVIEDVGIQFTAF